MPLTKVETISSASVALQGIPVFTATDNHYTIRDVESCKGFEISILVVISEYYEIIA